MQAGMAMRMAGRVVDRLRVRPTLLVRGLHGKSEGPSAGGGKFAASGSGGGGLLSGVGAGNGNRVGGRASAEWKAESTWRSPTPLFGGPSLLGVPTGGGGATSSGIIRGYNSFVGKDGGGEGPSKPAGGKKEEVKETAAKCCDHSHDHAGEACSTGEKGEGRSGGSGGAAAAPGGEGKKKREVPVVLKEEDEDDAFDITSHPVWNQESLSYLLDNNKRWVAQKTAEDPEFFKKLASVHKPEFLFIGCSDARLSVQHMLGLEAGELFVHRNVANMVMHTDLNLLTVLTYAVDYLKVKHIIVCGHYDCGGVRAAMKNHDHGLIENWIMGVRDVARLHRKELKALDDDEAIHRRLVELNVQEQCVKLYANPVMQKSQAKTGFPHVHAMVFDVGQGLVKELDIDFKSIIRKYRHVYSMYNFNDRPLG